MDAKFNLEKAEFVRSVSSFKHWLTKDRSAGPSGVRLKTLGLMAMPVS